MKINIKKCKVLSVAHNKKVIIHYDYSFTVTDANSVNLEHVEKFCDLGVVRDSELKFENHIYDKINIASKMLGIINGNFKDLDKSSFILLYKSLVRSRIEFAHSVWCPYKKDLIYDIEGYKRGQQKWYRTVKERTIETDFSFSTYLH